MEQHPIAPFYHRDSKILILGSFPSIKSREVGFYYAHPKNRFWKVLSKVYNEEIIDDIWAKKEFLKKNKIALFDVCKACDIKGSADASIKNVTANDIETILNETQIEHIVINGKTAYNLYNKLIKEKIKKEAICLPSTSPANATYSLNDLIKAYEILKNMSKCQGNKKKL